MKRIANECFFAWVESEIKSGRRVKFRVKGNSMMPLLRNGKDEVVVGPYDKEELKLFDVILFRQTDRYVLHRIIQKRGRYAGLPERRLKRIPCVGGWKAVCGWGLVDAEEWCCVS